MTEQPDILTDLQEFANEQPSADAAVVEPDEDKPDDGEEVDEGEAPAGAADVPYPYDDFDEPQDDEATEG
jgi:hypothetical protein